MVRGQIIVHLYLYLGMTLRDKYELRTTVDQTLEGIITTYLSQYVNAAKEKRCYLKIDKTSFFNIRIQ